MSKAIGAAAAEIGVAGGLLLANVLLPGVGAVITAAETSALWGLLASGIASEACAIAAKIGQNTGIGVTTRAAAQCRQIVRGCQRIPGTIVYCSTTGSTHRQYNMVIALATHPIESIINLYLDGRQVFWNTSSAYNQTVGGNNFGGDADGNNHTGPNGQQYNFGGEVFCAAFYGNQNSSPTVIGGSWVGPNQPNGFCSALQANDPTWSPSGSQTPYLAGCTYVYLKIRADSANFPQLPEVRFTVLGKNDIFDPRTGTTGYSSNWALHIADAITDPAWGLGDNTVNQDQLIAAANVCDELVYCAAGSEARYAVHCHYDTSTSPGDAIARMMDAGGGRLSRIGGEWFIWPAYWQGPSFTFDADALVGEIQWQPKRPMANLCNRVTGTYIAANYPYNIAGNLYDANGYWNGSTANNFPFAFQPTNFPPYACDALHGYGAGVDVYLAQDGGIYLPHELTEECVLSISQAQRLAKIHLLRNRQQGSGVFPMSLAAWQMQPLDVMDFNMPAMSWTNKVLEIASVKFQMTRGEGETAPSCTVLVGVQETDASVYEWDPATEELSPYDIPQQTGAVSSWMVAPPSNVIAVSDLGTALVQPDGTVIPRIELTWTEPTDTYVTNGGTIRIQMRGAYPATWQDVLVVSGQTTQVFLGNVVTGQSYDLRLSAFRSNGAQSAWVELDGIVCGSAPSATGMSAVGVGALIGVALTTGGAEIIVEPFTATVGTLSASILPAGPYTLSGENQGERYYIYYFDPNFAGGAITPIATQNVADFLGKPGYYLIDSIVTPKYTGGSYGGNVYRPSSWSDTGLRSTQTPGCACDADPATFAQLTAQNTSLAGQTNSDCVWAGFAPVVVPSGGATLTVIAYLLVPAAANDSTITATIGGVPTVLLSSSTSLAQASYTCAVPAGTDLSSISIEAIAGPQLSVSGASMVSLKIFDINIQ